MFELEYTALYWQECYVELTQQDKNTKFETVIQKHQETKTALFEK